MQQLQEFETFESKIETDDKTFTVTAGAVTIANAAPSTSVLAQGPAGIIYDDGLLDLTVVAPANQVSAIASAYHLLQTAVTGEAAARDDIGYLRTKRVKVIADPPQKVVLDGEIVGTTPIEVQCVPGGLTLLVPQSEDKAPIEKLEGLPNLKIKLQPPLS